MPGELNPPLPGEVAPPPPPVVDRAGELHVENQRRQRLRGVLKASRASV
jgi:hypothetical protein